MAIPDPRLLFLKIECRLWHLGQKAEGRVARAKLGGSRQLISIPGGHKSGAKAMIQEGTWPRDTGVDQAKDPALIMHVLLQGCLIEM